MKKTLFLVSVLLLSACSAAPAPQDNNNISSIPPAFLNLNNNIGTPDLNSNDNSTSLNTNTNGATGNSNTNEAADQNSNENAANLNTNQTVAALDINLLNAHETPFDCKPLSSYEKMEFYPKFQEKFESLLRYSSHDIKILSGESTTADKQDELKKRLSLKEDRGNIISSCLAKDQSLFVVLVKGDEGSNLGFKIVRYLPARELAEIGAREDERNNTHWNFYPTLFGKRTANVLSLTATGRDGENRITTTYAYNYVTNSLSVGEYCKQLSGGKKECGGYKY